MESNPAKSGLFNTLINKGTLKQDVYRNTHNTLLFLKKAMQELSLEYDKLDLPGKQRVSVVYKDRGQFEAEMRFAGDTLVLMMHSNIFEFSRLHEVMNLTWIREDKTRSYCGVIHVYNFLSDSLKYNRLNDIGYLIGRIFINRENHYFIEGKRELGVLYNNFATSVMNEPAARAIIESAMLYCINFDLLTPPYDQVKEVTIQEFQSVADNMRVITGKRLGFKFQADTD